MTISTDAALEMIFEQLRKQNSNHLRQGEERLLLRGDQLNWNGHELRFWNALLDSEGGSHR